MQVTANFFHGPTLTPVPGVLPFSEHPSTSPARPMTNPDEPRTDAQLIEAILAGEDAAFGALIERYHDAVLGFLIRFIGDRSKAEDTFQETFLQIHQSLETFDTTKRFKPWLFTIAANKARDLRRRESRRHAFSLSATAGDGDSGSEFVDLMAIDVPPVSDRVEALERSAVVQQAIDGLSEVQREVLLLAYFQQLTYQQLSEHLEVPIGTIKSRLHAAVASFAKRYTDLVAERERESEASAERRRIGPDPS